MNERIKELAEQAGMTDDKFGMFFAKDKHNEDGVDLEKFAELIIQECCLVIDKHYEPVYDGRLLMEHFGVE
jgi:hypothetical protein